MDARYEQAKKRVEDIKGFFVHLAIYVVVNLGVFALNMITSPDTLWFYWVTFGWGIGVAIHAVAFLIEGRFGSDWEERKIDEYLKQHPA